MGEVNEDVIYSCRCGSRIEWRLNFRGTVSRTAAPPKVIYRNLAARLRRLIDANPPRELRIRLTTATGDPVVLLRKAPSRTVTVGDGKTTYGSLNLATGEYKAVRELKGLPVLLGEADVDFVAAVKTHYELTGTCFFCGRELSDPRSVFAGYGPICAETNFLPWGDLPLGAVAPKHLEEVRARNELNPDVDAVAPRQVEDLRELNEDVIYTCACGVEITWRITAGRAMQIPPVRNNVYPGLTASLSRLIQISGSDHFRIRLVTTKKAEVVLLWNARSRAVTVSDGGTTKYGTLNLDDGTYHAIGGLEWLNELLEEADVSLVAAARRHGQETEYCSFCGLHLSDPQSLEAGYGPICAVHYGLPWGHVALVPSQPVEESVAGRAG